MRLFTKRAVPAFRPALPSRILTLRHHLTHSIAKPMSTNMHAPRQLELVPSEDDPEIRQKYRPFILDNATDDWVNSLELETVSDMAEQNLRSTGKRLRVLVLYGSLRRRSYSRLVALEASRILFRLGCDARVFDPQELPVKNDKDTGHPKVQELRELSTWSDGHVWVSPEQHGNLVSTSYTVMILNNQKKPTMF
jgi:arsenic resistance protein ArsH